MGNEEHLDDQIEDLEPAAEETDDVKGGLNFTSDASVKYQKVQPIEDASIKFQTP